jgi:DNA-binding MarR family transcriptional regulator
MPQAASADPIHRAITALQRLADAFAVRRRQLAASADLTEAEWRLLQEVEDADFMPSMFARRRECTPAAVSRGLRRLLEAGLVETAVSDADGRQRRYRPSAAGRSVLRRLRDTRRRAIQAVWERFDAAELDAFVGFATALAESLESYAARVAAPARGQRPRKLGSRRSRRAASAST